MEEKLDLNFFFGKRIWILFLLGSYTVSRIPGTLSKVNKYKQMEEKLGLDLFIFLFLGNTA